MHSEIVDFWSYFSRNSLLYKNYVFQKVKFIYNGNLRKIGLKIDTFAIFGCKIEIESF